MQILLTNDDGIHAPGLAAMERELAKMGDVWVVAPATEQSGVGHSITFLSPLLVQEVYDGPRRRGWAVEGSPADCVKIAVTELVPRAPDLVVSGINGGLNAGINVLYSGTVAAAIEGAFVGITSVAVSLEFDEQAQFDQAARLASKVIRQIQERIAATEGNPNRSEAESRLFNLNIPTVALAQPTKVQIVPMSVAPYEEAFEQRRDPRGRRYYWAAGGPTTNVESEETDLSALKKGFVTLTPLDYDLTRRCDLESMRKWKFEP